MIINKEKLNLQKKNKDNRINNIKNKPGDVYLKTILKTEDEQYDIKSIPNQNDYKFENKNINALDESKQMGQKQHKKAKINNYVDNFKTITNFGKNTKTFKESEIEQISDKDLLVNSNLNENEINMENKLNKKYFTIYNNKIYNNVNQKIINNENNNNNNKIKYSKIIYNNSNKIKASNSKDKYLNEPKDITKINYSQTIENYHLSRKNNNKYNSINFQRRNINDLEIDKFNNINKNKRIHRPFYSIKKSLLTLDEDIVFENKTVNNFYTKKKPSTNSVIEDRNILNKKNSNKISELNEARNYLYQEKDLDNLNLYNYRTIENYNSKKNINTNHKQIFRKKNSRIEITNNGAIKEFNISFNEDENVLRKNSLKKMYVNNKNNFMSLRGRRNRKYSIFEEYNKYYIKTLPPININQFNINATNANNSIQNLTENNTIKAYDNNYSSTYCEGFWTQGNTYNSLYNNIVVPNNAYNNTSHNTIKNYKINDIELSTNNNSKTIENNKMTNKILVKKRPIYEIRAKNHSYKKFNKLKYIQDKDIDNTDLSNYNNKKIKFKLHPTKQINFSIESKIAKNKNNEIAILEKKLKSLIDNINDKIIIIKKDKKHLDIIDSEKDIDKINQKLEQENFMIGNSQIKIISYNDYNNLKNKENELKEENNKLKNQNELLVKKGKIMEELFKKLDKEKQNLIEENDKVTKESSELKTLNEKLKKEIESIKEENIKINNSLNDFMRVNKSEVELFDMGNIGGINFNVDIESINDLSNEKLGELKDLFNQENK